jgi:hypothetical protein
VPPLARPQTSPFCCLHASPDQKPWKAVIFSAGIYPYLSSHSSKGSGERGRHGVLPCGVVFVLIEVIAADEAVHM